MFSVIFPPSVVGALTVAAYLAATVAAFVPLAPALLLKLIPYRPLQRACSRWCVGVATTWVAVCKMVFRLLHAEQWQLDLRTPLEPGRNYLLISNHQSWADILVLFDLLHGRAPFPRFFLKHALLYVPVIGMACWGMDFPFMRRYSKAQLAAHPELKGQDVEATRRACEIYRSEPVTVINFLEGTRFSEAKRVARQSPYRHLLRPKAGGLSFTLNAMGEQFAGIIDVTIAYRPSRHSLLWSWASGEQDQLAVHVDVLPIPAELAQGDYEHDAEFRARFQTWVNTLWARKDARLGRMLDARPTMQEQRPAAL
ncbi:acyltransferase [Solimonas marina]|uniref:Acyltransferase n=1 Tax=Solimonas marina TaxID=2714601 RepID=A0A969W822_9GAMM|nr:acyltransferase [Solimonas marina]NKF21199.1 acyltransferase [Solimonas marina]